MQLPLDIVRRRSVLSRSQRLLLVGVAGLGGCPDTQIDAEPGERGLSRAPAVRAGDSDERELAHRLGAPDTRHLPVGRPPVPPQSVISDPDTDDRALDSASPIVDGIAMGDMVAFERRLRSELSTEGLSVIAVDLERHPEGRLFVVVPATPTDPSSRAASILRRTWLVFAEGIAPEPSRPSRVRIAYLPPRSADDPQDPTTARIDAALHRAAEG